MSSSMMNCYLVGASGLKQMRGFVAPSRMPKVVPRELRVREAVAWLVRKKRSGAHWAPLIKHVIPKLIGHSSEGAGIYIYICICVSLQTGGFITSMLVRVYLWLCSPLVTILDSSNDHESMSNSNFRKKVQ